MLFSLIGKQIKMLIRNKQPLIILLVMPIVLITILSLALAGIMDNGAEEAIQARLVLVDESTWEQEKVTIQEFLEKEGITGPPLEALLTQIENNNPIQILENNILASNEIEKYISVEHKQPKDLDTIRQDKEVDGILTVRPSFRLNYVKSAYFDKKVEPNLDLYLSQENEIRASIIQSVISEWQYGFTQSLALSKAGLSIEEVMENTKRVEKVEQVLEDHEREIPSSIYYTVGMLVMFALYVPAFLAGFALQEVQWKVYDRIILAGISSTLYALSIFITGTLVALVQQIIMLSYGKFALKIEWIGLEGMIDIVLSYSVFVGGLAALLTTLQFRSKSDGILNAFTGFIVSIFAFLGGSFINIGDISETLANIGDFTPNGAAMTAILSIQKGQEIAVIWPYMAVLYGYVSLCVLLAIVLFPRRGVTV